MDWIDSPVVAITISGLLMSLISLVGWFTFVVSEERLQRIVMPLVALAAGSLIGGAFFHLLPEAIEESNNSFSIYAWLVAGFVTFFILEQFMHWHHCHKSVSHHTQPLTWMLLASDTLHNFIGGLAVGASFVVDIRLGITTWLVAAAHEVPQELGDFGVLVHGGWSRKKALLFNFFSSLSFLVGGWVICLFSEIHEVAPIVAFAAGNFLYIGAADLIPEIKHHGAQGKPWGHLIYFSLGMGVLLVVRFFMEHQH